MNKNTLLQAAIDGKLELVTAALTPGRPLPDSLLHQVIFSGWAQGEDVRMLELLLDRGADLEGRARAGATPLHEAARIGPFPERSRAVTELLLRRGAVVDARDDFGRTPLHIAVTTVAEETVQRLIQAGADVNALTRHRASPLHECVASYHEHFDPEEDGAEGAAAAESYVAAALEHLLRAGAEVDLRDDQGETPLSLMLRRPGASERIVTMLADAGARLTEPVRASETEALSPLAAGLVQGFSPEFMRRLMAAGNDPAEVFDFFGGASIICIAAANRPQVALALFEAAPDLISRRTGARDSTMLHCAALSDDDELVRLLLDRGLDPEAQDGEGKTPMERATEQGCERTAACLRAAQ